MIKQLLLKNWKTTLAGCAFAVLTYLVSSGHITQQQYTLCSGIAGALGFALSKDGNVTGNANTNGY